MKNLHIFIVLQIISHPRPVPDHKKKKNMDFTDKVILITGASSGIGAASAEYFAKLGGLIAIVGRNEENLGETANKCQLAAPIDVGEPLIIVADVTSESDVERIIESTIERFGKIDVLVNNAGIIAPGSIETTSLEQYDHIMNTNLRSVYQLTMLAVPHLIETKGNIVNISSVLGIRAFTNILAYSLSKAAIEQFTKCVALELAPKGVRVNVVTPGVIETELHKISEMDEEQYEQFVASKSASHALGRIGSVNETSAAIAFLASDLATFTTGASLPVDGGKNIMCPR